MATAILMVRMVMVKDIKEVQSSYYGQGYGNYTQGYQGYYGGGYQSGIQMRFRT